MTSQYRHRRSSDPTRAFAQLEPGEIATNTANRQLAVGDAAGGSVGNPLPLLALRYFDVRAAYVTGDLVVNGGVVYRANAAVSPGPFTPGQWTMLVGTADPQYVLKAGDVMTGALALSGNPAQDLHAAPKQYVDSGDDARVAVSGDVMTGALALAGPPSQPEHATSKAYVDAALANKSSVISSDTPPPAPIDNTLWFETDTGLLYVRYNDGTSTQWVIACPQPDTALFVQRTGDTMTGGLTLPAPTLGGHATNKTYVDAVKATAVDALAYSGMQINGGMEVSQERGATPTTASSGYICDGWKIGFNGTMATSAYQSVNGTQIPGIPNCLVVSTTTAQASIPAGIYASVSTNIEGYRVSRLGFGKSGAGPVTVAFWTAHTRTGTYSVSLRNGTGTRSCAASYTQNVTNTWEYKTVSFPGCTDGGWANDYALGMMIDFALAVGSTFTAPATGTWYSANYFAAPGQINAVAATSDNFRLTGVVVLPGIEAPSAERAPLIMRPYDQELLTCQRYFWKFQPGITNTPFTIGHAQSTSTAVFRISYPINMRAGPTVTVSAAGEFITLTANGTPWACTGLIGDYALVDGCRFVATAGGMVAGDATALLTNGTAGSIKWDARL